MKNILSVRNRLILGFILVAILLFIVIIRSLIGASNTAVAHYGEISDTITTSGNVLSNGQTPIFSTTTGVITNIYVSNGETVTTGQKLASVKSTASDQEKKAAYADYAAAISQKNIAYSSKPLLQSELEAARQKVLDASQAVTTMTNNRNVSKNNPDTGLPYTQTEIDSINSALTSAKENFSSLEQQYNNSDNAITAANANLAAKQSAYQATQDSVITAPADGTIANLAFSPGDRITATAIEIGAQTTPLLIIADFSRTKIKVALNEIYISKVALHQPATVTFDALPGKTYTAHVDRIDAIGTNTQGVIAYNVYLPIDHPNPTIRADMTANVVIHANKHRALLVPNNAFFVKNGTTYVHVKRNGQSDTQVQVGTRGVSLSEVQSGVQDGDEITIINH